MACALLVYSIQLARILTCCSLLAGTPVTLEYYLQGNQDLKEAPTLVRVNIITEIRGAKDTVELNGQLLTDYSPTIIQDYSSVGIVLDHKGNILTFLGYRWVDIQNRDPRIEISTSEGQKWKGKLLGIDQSNGVAVIRLLNGKLRKTPVCTQCEIKDGVTVVSPVIEGPGPSQYREAQILSVSAGSEIPEQGGWTMAVNRPFPDAGLPILTTDHRVIGFVASQDPMDMRTVVYPIARLLSSAEKILKTGGDIRAGWLGVFLMDPRPAANPGILIQRVEPDSPAQKAGLVPQDFLVRYNGREIRNARQFIQLVEGTPIGSKADLEITRQGNPMTVTALIEERKPRQNPDRLSFNFPGPFGSPASGMNPEMGFGNPRLLFGLHTIVLTPSLSDALHMPGQTGLLVTDIDKQLPADQAGVLVGDIVTAVDGQPIVDVLSFASFLQTHSWGAQSVLSVLRKGIERTIVVQIPEKAD